MNVLPNRANVFETRITLPGRSVASLAATTPCRLQLCTVSGSSASKQAGHYYITKTSNKESSLLHVKLQSPPHNYTLSLHTNRFSDRKIRHDLFGTHSHSQTFLYKTVAFFMDVSQYMFKNTFSISDKWHFNFLTYESNLERLNYGSLLGHQLCKI